MKVLRHQRSIRSGTLVLLAVLACAALFHADRKVSAEAFVPITWDGGGTTNNWSEAANWSGDTVPAAGDDVTFDATSSKNVTIDTSINVGSIFIASGYSGTITQSNAASIQTNGCNGRICFVQSGGTFNGSTNTITLNSAGFGGFRMLGGTFNGGSGNINLPSGPALGADFLLQGGTFKSTSGNLTVAGHFAFQNPGATFLHNGGTVTLTADQPQFLTADGDHLSINFNNLNVNSANGVNYDFGLRVIVEGNLALNDGSIGQSNNGTIIEARGGFSVSPNFDGGIGRVEFGPSGAPRTITLVAGLVYPSIRLNDPNLNVNTSGSGTLVMPHQLNINQGTFNQGNVDMTIDSLGISGGTCLAMSGGTYNGSTKTITLNSDGFGTVFMTGGTFNGGSGDIITAGDAINTNHDIQVNGGIFRSTSGSLFVARAFRFQNSGAFVNNGGTVVFTGGTTTSIVSDDGMGHSPILVFNNLTYNRDSGSRLQLLADGIRVNGTLSLTDGIIDDGGGFRFIEALGNVNVASTFDGLTFRIKLIFSGAACQTVTLNGTQTFPGVWQTNKTGCGITAVGNFGVGSISVPNGNFTFGPGSHATLTNDMTVDANGRITIGDNSDVRVGTNATVNGSVDIVGSHSAFAVGSVDISGTGGDLIINGNNNNVAAGTVDVSGTGADLSVDGDNNTLTTGSVDISGTGGDLTLDGTNNVINAGNGQIGGDLELSGSGNTVRFDSLTIAPAGALIADSPDVIVLGGDVVNNGLVNLHAFGSECGTGTYVTLQSSAPGTRRSWSGNGVFRMVNVTVFDMGGTAQIKAHNSIDSGGNNGPNWLFDSVCQPRVLHAPSDFDGDGKTDIAMFRPSTAEWWMDRSTLGVTVPRFGLITDRPAPADFDGDGITDVAVWRELAQSSFFIVESSTNTLRIEDFGIIGDDPRVVGDWDGDGRADPAVYRRGSSQNAPSQFFFRGSKNNPGGNITFLPWGLGSDQAVNGDFDGDGKQDPAIFRTNEGDWWLLKSSDGSTIVQHWGLSADKTLVGDFDGDGKSDLAVFRPSDTNWYILQSSNNQERIQPFGTATDVLTPGDYDGDGKTDLSIFRPSNGQNWTLLSSSGTSTTVVFGASGDIPAASAIEP